MNEEPAFLSVDQVGDMHRAALEAFSGDCAAIILAPLMGAGEIPLKRCRRNG